MFGRLRRLGRTETLNERLLREAREAEPVAAEAPTDELADDAEERAAPFLRATPTGPGPSVPTFHDRPSTPSVQTRQWDVRVFVDAPALRGEEIAFHALADGSLIVSVQEGDESLDPLADALAEHIDPPYEAGAMRLEGTTWMVGASPVDVVELPAAPADEFTLSVYRGEYTLGEAAADPGSYEPLAQLAAGYDFPDFVAEAKRLEGTTFAVTITAL